MADTLFPESLTPLARAVRWDAVPVVHKPALLNAQDPWFGYKSMSLVEACSSIEGSGDWAQFGVGRGQTARVLEAVMPTDRRLHLFDRYDGLPEAWLQGGWQRRDDSPAVGALPRFDPRKVQLHRGWFQDTVPPFCAGHDTALAFVHIDCNHYASAMDVLCGLNDLLRPGTVLLFDEFFMQVDGQVADDECRALHDWAAQFGRRWKLLWRTRWVQAAVRVET